jgi:pimeloyl-ACP methyl ester carboxylesterase
VIFAAGSGGNPERHLPLLAYLADQSFTVIAPHFDRLVSPTPTEDELLSRARRLRIAIDYITQKNLPVVGIGHSIGATLLTAIAGAQMWMGPGQRVPISTDERLKRLVLFTPPTGFFKAPGALDGVSIPIQVWAGTKDAITPPSQAEFLESAIENSSVELHVVEGAGHFSFLNTLPPQVADPLADRETFLKSLAVEVSSFAGK